MSKVRVVFLGTPDFAVTPLEFLAQDDHFEIVQVISQPDRKRDRMKMAPSPVKETALRLGLPVQTTESVNTPEFLNTLKACQANVAVVIAFGQIVSQDFLNLFPFGAVNVHGSLLPRWRGAAPIQRAIEAGDSETGVALQIMVKQLDAGPVLGVRKTPILDTDNASTIYEKLKQLSCELLHVELMDYIRGNLVGQKQDESLVTIAPKISKTEGLVNWKENSKMIWNKMRAFSSWPGIWTHWNEKKMFIRNAKPTRGSGDPGKVLQVQADRVVVACGEGALEILEVQLESKGLQAVETFLRGHKIEVGDTLGL